MNLTLTEEQQMLADTVREMCDAGCDGETVRLVERRGEAFPPDLWKHLSSSGLVGLSVPEQFEGAGAGLVEMCLVAQELGRSAAPLTPIVSSVLAGGMLARAASTDQQSTWLPRIASGEALVSVAWLEDGGGYGAKDVAMAAEIVDDRVRLCGSKTLVPFADRAAAFIVPVRCGSRPEDIDLYLVPAGPGVVSTPQRTLAGESLHRLDLDIEVSDNARLGEPGQGWQMLHGSMAEAAIAFAAYACGGARKVLELATEYAKTREQFGRPIGVNQGIAHPLADTLVAVEGATTLMFEAAWSRDAGRDVRILAAMAKQRCCEVFRDAAAVAHQVYGGIGYTLDIDIQLYSRRAKQLQLTWWDNRFLSDYLASLLLDEDGPGLLPPMIER
ncbi:acyl-CoA dehydrogenase family protein [Prescottella equi]|uniref:acyl-CoA dehydrogenase family protein n=1 Tax=Rhodococcus hoagii TaxID=43767 RepID=UPI000D0F897A|nr:acyl-CoA dehydrogenase family protein [Prescottella equi]AVP71405.1 acyl-CoA dehydrogenase [Prescottella equi]MCD7052788.1 acyl-CoA/acyl-ACP dehydrogenase [Rhodococcus sp. BH2-1]